MANIKLSRHNHILLNTNTKHYKHSFLKKNFVSSASNVSAGTALQWCWQTRRHTSAFTKTTAGKWETFCKTVACQELNTGTRRTASQHEFLQCHKYFFYLYRFFSQSGSIYPGKTPKGMCLIYINSQGCNTTVDFASFFLGLQKKTAYLTCHNGQYTYDHTLCKKRARLKKRKKTRKKCKQYQHFCKHHCTISAVSCTRQQC